MTRYLLMMAMVVLTPPKGNGGLPHAPRPAVVEARVWDKLAAALSFVESRDDDRAYNASSGALGRWQMKRIYVDEVNRILRLKRERRRYRYEDRTNPVKARERNPKNDKGHKSKKDHQFLSEDLGKPKLKEHLAAIEALGRASGYDWDKFKEMLDKAFPIQDKLYDKIMRGECGDPNIEEDMKGIAKGIFSYNPKTDPRDPLFKKNPS